jgi:hypothetical protein
MSALSPTFDATTPTWDSTLFTWDSNNAAPAPALLNLGKTTEWWTADTTLIRADSLYFTADGADIVNGGGISIPEAPPGKSFNKPAYTVSAIIRF